MPELAGSVARPPPVLPTARPRRAAEYGGNLGLIPLGGIELTPAITGVTHQTAAAFVDSIDLPDWTGQELGAAEGDNLTVHGFALGNPAEKPAIWFVSGVHGDEWQAGWGAKRLAEYLDDPEAAPVNRWFFRYLRQRYAWYWVPVVNPSGWNAQTRNNVNNVDIGRNFISKSEAETVLVAAEFDRVAPVIAIDFHTFPGPTHKIGLGRDSDGLHHEEPLIDNVVTSLATYTGNAVERYATPTLPEGELSMSGYATSHTSQRGTRTLACYTEGDRQQGGDSMATFCLRAALIWLVYSVQWDTIHHGWDGG